MRIAYWHSLLGAELKLLRASLSTLANMRAGIADPFRLPRLLRNLAAFQSVPVLYWTAL